jgi:hypothetical protein
VISSHPGLRGPTDRSPNPMYQATASETSSGPKFSTVAVYSTDCPSSIVPADAARSLTLMSANRTVSYPTKKKEKCSTGAVTVRATGSTTLEGGGTESPR